MQIELDQIADWCNLNKLTLNANKTQFMTFGNKNVEKKFSDIRLYMKNEPLTHTSTYKYLGTTLDSRLTGQKQLNKVTSIIAMHLNTFRKIRHLIDTKTAITLYKATILPILDYNDSIYYLLTKQNQNKLQTLQNRALRIVFRHEILSTNDMHTRAQIDGLELRREQHMLREMLNRSKIYAYMDRNKVNTRARVGPMLKITKTTTAKAQQRAPNYIGGKLWNALPATIRLSKTALEFKMRLKRQQ